MFNYKLQEEIYEKRKYKAAALMVLLSLVPFAIFLRNAEANFRKAGVKDMHNKRRQRLDEEHGINRDRMREDFNELDKMYRVTEKEEILKYQQIGKSATDYYQEQQGVTVDRKAEPPVPREEGQVVDKVRGEDVEVQYIRSGDYEQVQVRPQQSDVNDPRVGGAKIIFDSRLDKFQRTSTPEQAKEHIKRKQEELPPYTLEDKKQMLIKMLKKDGAKPANAETVPEAA